VSPRNGASPVDMASKIWKVVEGIVKPTMGGPIVLNLDLRGLRTTQCKNETVNNQMLHVVSRFGRLFQGSKFIGLLSEF
jgi:hypothetical protein